LPPSLSLKSDEAKTSFRERFRSSAPPPIEGHLITAPLGGNCTVFSRFGVWGVDLKSGKTLASNAFFGSMFEVQNRQPIGSGT
jgi:hypothetical protein